MANPSEDLPGFDFPPLNTISADYDMALQRPLSDTGFADNVEMFMDPQFWSMDLNSGAQGHEHGHDFSNFDVGDLANVAQTSNGQSMYHPDLTSPTSTVASPTHQKISSPHELKRESATKKSMSTADSPGVDDDDDLKVSTEEDKRRRNTAASARFRVKKKQREQAMEKTAKEMTDKVSSLESRVKELEKENKLLKGLLTEKATGRGKQSESSSSDEETTARSSKRTKLSESSR